MYRLQNPGRDSRKTNGITPPQTHTPRPQSIGRFAPSPTGPLHLGSLYTALASYLQARAQKGLWLLRIDDLDVLRNDPDAVNHILTTLDNFGLHWDGEVLYESHHPEAYEQALDQLQNKQLLYPCICSRKQLIRYRQQHPNTADYPGFCREQPYDSQQSHAVRVKTFDRTIAFTDGLQGRFSQNLFKRHGDFIVKRRDRIIAYQLSAVVGERMQGITEVVRGYDLLDSTLRQIYLQQQLGYSTPNYLHVPVIVDNQGVKLSKQSFAAPVSSDHIGQTLYSLLVKLKQQPPKELNQYQPEAILDWAIAHWQPEKLKQSRSITL